MKTVRTLVSCTRCKSEISLSNIKRHYGSKSCLAGGKQPVKLPTPASLDCGHCGKHYIKLNNFRQHEVRCPQNPNREYANGMKNKIPWNKGLTKETSTLVKQYADKIKALPTFGWAKGGYTHSIKTKE